MKQATATVSKKAGPKLDLTRLSAVAQIAVQPTQAPDAELELDRIYSVPQVRKIFVNLEELAASLKLNGMVEPILVHEEADGRFRVIVGERRFRAAPMAGLTKVPVIIKRGLTELEIRRIQNTENNDRADLTAFEEAMGVIEDVEKYGTKEAMLIWNRGEAWISKRMAVKRYAPPVRELLEKGVCGDFEVLHCLNQIYEVEESHAEFLRLCSRLDQGLPLSRDEARNLLSRLKTWKQQQEQLDKRRQELGRQHQTRGGTATDSAGDDAANGSAAPENVHHRPFLASGEQVSGGQSGSNAAAVKREQQTFPIKDPTPEQKAAAEREYAAAALDSVRNETFERGETNLGQFSSMKSHMLTLGYDLHQTEWVLWDGFLSITLPMLESIGPERAVAYLKKLQGELKCKTPMQLWDELHPEQESGRKAAPNMPEGWRF